LACMKNKQRSREFWEKAVERAESGGKTRAQVAKELGVGVPALCYWIYKLRSERSSPTTSSCRALVPVRVVEPSSASSAGLSLEIDGMTLRFEQWTDVGYLARLAGAIRAC
jgi:transposase-like protein